MCPGKSCGLQMPWTITHNFRGGKSVIETLPSAKETVGA